jgi:hypothetical protein
VSDALATRTLAGWCLIDVVVTDGGRMSRDAWSNEPVSELFARWIVPRLPRSLTGVPQLTAALFPS